MRYSRYWGNCPIHIWTTYYNLFMGYGDYPEKTQTRSREWGGPLPKTKVQRISDEIRHIRHLELMKLTHRERFFKRRENWGH